MAPWMLLVEFPLYLSMRGIIRQSPEASKIVFNYTFIIACQLSFILVYSLYNAAFANLKSHW